MWDRLEDIWHSLPTLFEKFVCFVRGHRWCEITYENGHHVYVCIFCLKKDRVPGRSPYEVSDDGR